MNEEKEETEVDPNFPKIIELRAPLKHPTNPKFSRYDIVTDRFSFCIRGDEAKKLYELLKAEFKDNA